VFKKNSIVDEKIICILKVYENHYFKIKGVPFIIAMKQSIFENVLAFQNGMEHRL